MDAVVTKAGKKLFQQHLEQYAPADPLYEFYTDKKGRQKRRKRELPPGLSHRDAKILRSVKRRAHYLDKGISLCGVRVGWTFFIGLVPLVGDVADALLNYLLVVKPSLRADIPPWLVRRMLMNNAVSAGIGMVPIAGDVALAVFKANSRNAALLEEFLRIRGEEFIKMAGEGAVHPQDAHAKRGWFGGGKGNGKGKGKAPTTAPLLSAGDVEQVKPGSGMTGTEMREALPVPESSPPPAYKSQGKQDPPPAIATASLAPPTTGETGKKGSPHSGGSTSSGLSGFFGRKKTATGNAPPLKAGTTEKGRFVEDVHP